MMLPRILFAYLALFQFGLLFASYFMNQEAAGDVTLTRGALGMFMAALGAFTLALVLPRRLGGKVKAPGAGTSHPLSKVIAPYMIRVCLFEVCTVLGFVAGFLHHDWRYMVPFAALGLAGTALSAPTEALFAKLRNG